ncbi:MAG: hypothetical protein COS99_01740 [Candidatus Omnitrophica bacterium CG07_land_8_20_14_0_80_42_15]|uniref:Poly A polymerase head domain-containing protein n=1 Tax=Candidatus Aquitaenariimonas noxiae TaxID=1974741 RepID=A0A2J0L238_9BACT|nr:MAG: hypothetical protein COS99_01740 [Candidatus Omnitrophica bacterium CG07_land_8_20_14_0_80_42_15]
MQRPLNNISNKLKKDLPGEIYSILTLIGKTADQMGYKAYIVGGFVRDLFLGRKNFDVDISVEPDGIKFAGELAKKLKGTIVVHKHFGTASIYIKRKHKGKRAAKIFPDVMKIDVATARRESYEKPAVLPKVSFSSIREDLSRRDFTINAIAASLNRGDFGEVIDFFGGIKDLAAGIVRVLHGKSFIDDPTRIFRAVRFEQRFSFEIEPHTIELIKNAMSVKMFEKVEKQRIREEVILILKEKDPVKALMRMNELHEFRFIHRKMKLTKGILKTLGSVKKSACYFNYLSGEGRAPDIWLVYFMALVEELPLKDAQRLSDSFVFRNEDKARILSCKEKSDKVLDLLIKPKNARGPSAVYRILKPLSLEIILFIYAKSERERTRSLIKSFLIKHNKVRLDIGGDYLKRIGMKPGPKFKTILEETLYAKIDGMLKTARDEKKFVLQKFCKK